MATLEVVPPPELPEIKIGIDTGRQVKEAIAALAKAPNVYQRAGSLVHVLHIRELSQKKRKGVRTSQGTPVIQPIPLGTLIERLDGCARWLRYDSRSKDWKGTTAPSRVINAIHTRGEWDGVRPLQGVITAPALRADGSILQRPGYDEETGLLYEPSASFPEVPEHPSPDDARRATAVLLELVKQFPFAQPHHRSAWLAGLLTILARNAIDGPVPMFALDATTAGVGKTTLVDAAVRLVTGADCACTSMPENDDEMRKRITSLVLDGDPTVCLDNLRGKLAFTSLEGALTSTVWKDRALGSLSTVLAPHRIVWWATGNNLLLGGDLARRVLHIRLESDLERPEERDDLEIPRLLEFCDANRARLCASALTILRGYLMDPHRPPPPAALWGRFEAWCVLIPGCLRWLGEADPMLARATCEEGLDDERQQLGVFLGEFARLHRLSGPMTAKGIVDALYPAGPAHEREPDGFDDLREVIEAATHAPSGRPPDTTRFGRWLRSMRGRVLGGKRLARQLGDGGTARWFVR